MNPKIGTYKPILKAVAEAYREGKPVVIMATETAEEFLRHWNRR